MKAIRFKKNSNDSYSTYFAEMMVDNGYNEKTLFKQVGGILYEITDTGKYNVIDIDIKDMFQFEFNDLAIKKYVEKKDIESYKEEKVRSQKIADIVIPHHTNHKDLKILLDCLDVSIFNIIIVAGNSFGVNCNKGAKLAETDKIIFMNDDIEITTEQLLRIVNNIGEYDFVSSTQIAGTDVIKKYWGIGLFKNEDGSIRHQIAVNEKKSLFHSGFCFGVKKNTWKKIGGFDERFMTGNEDVDLGFKALEMKCKIKILDLDIRHKECQSEGRFDHCDENEKLIYKLWDQKYLKKIYKKYYK